MSDLYPCIKKRSVTNHIPIPQKSNICFDIFIYQIYDKVLKSQLCYIMPKIEVITAYIDSKWIHISRNIFFFNDAKQV